MLFAGAGAAFLLTVDVPGRGTGRGAVVGVVTVRAGDVYALVGTKNDMLPRAIRGVIRLALRRDWQRLIASPMY